VSKIRYFLFCLPVVALAVAAPRFAEPTPVRVGVYDSRAVVIAFTHSAAGKADLEKLMARYKAEKDETARAALEKEGAALQDRRHRQGFSTASIADVLEHMKGSLPTVANQAHVDVLVSKWDVAFQKEGVEFVDVTNEMVAPFQPDENVKKMIESLSKVEPMALYGTQWETLEKH